MEILVSDIPAWDGKSLTFFYSAVAYSLSAPVRTASYGTLFQAWVTVQIMPSLQLSASYYTKEDADHGQNSGLLRPKRTAVISSYADLQEDNKLKKQAGKKENDDISYTLTMLTRRQ